MQTLKYSILSFLFTLICSLCHAQNTKTGAAEKLKQLPHVLQMDSAKLFVLKNKLVLFSDSIKAVLGKSGQSKENKEYAIKLIQNNRKNYLQSTLSNEQYNAFLEYEKSISNLSIHKKNREKEENKLKQRGIKIVTKNSQESN